MMTCGYPTIRVASAETGNDAAVVVDAGLRPEPTEHAYGSHVIVQDASRAVQDASLNAHFSVDNWERRAYACRPIFDAQTTGTRASHMDTPLVMFVNSSGQGRIYPPQGEFCAVARRDSLPAVGPYFC
jgi:hypothetical protein